MTSGLNNNNNFQYPNLPVSLIWPENEEDIPWFMNRLYEQMVYAINSKGNGIFKMAIGSTATLIPNMNSFGSYLMTISGEGPYIDDNGVLNYWPAATFSFNKVRPDAGGTFNQINAVAGFGPTLNLVTYTPTVALLGNGSTNTYFFIRHNATGITGSFNVNIQGTQ